MATDTCHWHPGRETGLHCPDCGRAMCTECMRHHPVGIKCKECAKIRSLPTFQVSGSYMARGIAAAIGMGIVGSLGLNLVFWIFPAAGFLFFIVMIGLGYVVGEGVSKAVNRRRGRPYQYMALAGVLLATAPVFLVSLISLSFAAATNLLGIGLAGLVAWNRLER